MHPSRSGLFRRFAVLLGALCVAPVVVLGLLMAQLGGRSLESAARERHQEAIQRLSREIEGRLGEAAEGILVAMAAVPHGADSPQAKQALERLAASRVDIISLAWLDREGHQLAGLRRETAMLLDAGTHDMAADVRRLLKSRRRLLCLPSTQGIPAVAVYGIVDGRTVARIVLSLETLQSLIGGQKIGETGFAALIDRGGRLLVVPPGRLSDSQAADFPRWGIAGVGSAGEPGVAEFEDPGGLPRLAAFAPVPSLGGTVLLLQSREEAYRRAWELRWTVIVIAFVVAGLCLAGAIGMVLRLTRPILALTEAAQAVSEGNFLGRVDVTTGDELQGLAETFNRMTAELRSYQVLHVDRLVAEQRKTEAILFSITDGIIMTDNEGKIQLANRRALEILGLNPLLSLEGRTIPEAVPDARVREALLAAVASPKPDSFTDINLTTGNARRFLRVSSLPVISPRRGAPIGIVTAVRDVTLLRELDLMKDEFLQFMTHDLRNPVSSVLGFVEILRKGTVGILNPEQQNVTMSIKRASIRLLGMIDNILDIAKMESGRIQLQLKNVSLAAIGARAVSILESLAILRGIHLQLVAPEEFKLPADSDLLERVFVNLIGNAIKYTPEGGTITVRITDEEREMKVCVEDTGEGIPHDYLERVFAKFEQVTGHRKGGTGLGLTIVKFFVEAHLGRVWVESEPGKGARFIFTIPKGLIVDQEGRVLAKGSRAAA